MAERSIVVAGASAGGVEALSAFCRGLPRDMPAALFVVLHIAPASPSMLPAILQRFTALPATAVFQEEPIVSGHIYVAAPDRHLVLTPGVVTATCGPRENHHRPAIDTLFRSAARSFGPRVIGVLLSGMGDDGVSGLLSIKAAGGMALVQLPDEAPYNQMPVNALRQVAVDRCLPSYELGTLVGELTSGSSPTQAAAPNASELSPHPRLSRFPCPYCHGAMWESELNGTLRLECRVGHAHSPASLLVQQGESVESALWAAVRALEDSAALDRQLETHYPGDLGTRHLESARDKEAQAAVLRRLLLESP